jgi:MFS family permease
MNIGFVFALMFANVANVLAGRVLLTLFALNLGARPFDVGMLAATFALFPMLLSWLSGRLTDRFGARWPITLASLASSAGMLVPYFFPGLPTVFFAAAMLGFSLTFFSVSTQNLVGLMSTEHNRTRNYSNYTMLGSVGSFVGPLIAGFGIDHVGYQSSLLCLVAWPFVPVLLLLVWGDKLPKGSRSAAPTGSIKRALQVPGVWRILALSSLAQCGTNIFQFYTPVYATSIGMSASTIGVILAMYAVAGFGSRMMLPGLIASFSPKKVLACAFLLGAISFTLVPFSTSANVLAFLAFLFGFGMNCSQPITMMSMYSSSKGGRSGEALGLRFTADNATKIVIPFLFGMLATVLGLGAIFWGSAVLLVSGSLLSRDKKEIVGLKESENERN